MASPQRPPLLPFNPEGIPEALREQPRWAPWKAVWSEKRQKYDKIPCYPTAPFYGLSTAKPERWCTYAVALAAARANPEVFAGIGYVMTGPHDLVGVDLDRCVTDGQLAPWAAEVVQTLASYAEVSPSGNGARVFVRGDIAADWNNHDTGIEVYAGHEPRFLTVTGTRLAGTPADITRAQPDALHGLAARYARERSAPAAQVISLTLPDLVDELLLPDLAALELPYQAKDFLLDGTTRGDRSRELFAAAVALYGAGLDDATVFSLLAACPHSMEVALDHRRHDHDRALMYLWVEHCQKAKGRAGSRVATLDDFEDVSGGRTAVAKAAAALPSSRQRFTFTSAEDFFDPSHPPPRWLIKNLLPEYGLGMVFGPSKSGKTFFVLDLAMSIALGKAWRGRKVNAGQVAYICAEGGAGFRKRGRAYLDYHGLDRQGLPFHLLADAPNLLDQAHVKDLIVALKAIDGLKLVVVDTLAQTTPGANENSGEDMGRAMAHCNKIAAATGALVLLVGHTGKDEDKGHRGWSGMPAAFDVSIQLERSGDYRSATVDKLKDGDGEGDEFPFHLQSVVVGEDEDGEPETSCVALPGNKQGAKPAAPPLGALQRTIFETAVAMLDLNPAVTIDELRKAVVAQIPKPPAGRQDNRVRDVNREYPKLIAKGVLREDAGFVLLKGA